MDKVRENLKLIMCVFCFVVFAWLVQVTRYDYSIEVPRVKGEIRVDRLTGKIQVYSFERRAWAAIIVKK